MSEYCFFENRGYMVVASVFFHFKLQFGDEFSEYI